LPYKTTEGGALQKNLQNQLSSKFAEQNVSKDDFSEFQQALDVRLKKNLKY